MSTRCTLQVVQRLKQNSQWRLENRIIIFIVNIRRDLNLFYVGVKNHFYSNTQNSSSRVKKIMQKIIYVIIVGMVISDAECAGQMEPMDLVMSHVVGFKD
jgi:hypothetical protein